MREATMEHLEDERYLLFQLGSELYGTPLLGVREVVEPQETKVLPNTKEYFAGVINIRGEIVSVIDLRIRLKHKASHHPLNALMVFDTGVGPMAALVDKVESVMEIGEKDIERDPHIENSLPIAYLLGIAKTNGRLVTLIDLNQILSSQELSTTKSFK